MRICLAGPIAVEQVAHLLQERDERLPPGYSGAPLMAALLGELHRRGHELVAITTDPTVSLSRAPALCASGERFELAVCPARPRAWRWNGLHPGRAVDAWRLERKYMREIMKSSAPDIVHAHWTYEFAKAAQESDLPNLITCHDSPGVLLRHTRSPYRAVRYLMAASVLRHARHISAVSTYMANDAHRLSGQEVIVIPNPVADYVLEAGFPRQRPASRRLAMVCNGMQRYKNVELGIQAFARFRSQEPTAELHAFGSDLGRNEKAQHWAESKGLASGILFHGLLPHRELIERLKEMDALLHPALEESFGVAVAEAMALGLPIVAGKESGAVPWVVGLPRIPSDSLPAVLTDVGDPLTICAAISEVFDDRYPQRSITARTEAAARFSASTVADQYLAQYARILSETSRLPDRSRSIQPAP